MKELLAHIKDKTLSSIADKVLEGKRITPEEGIILYEKATLPLLGVLAESVRRRINYCNVYFNRNFHIEPTNICINDCIFCSFRSQPGNNEKWEYSINDMIKIVESLANNEITEIHITGGVHPDRDINFYCDLLNKIRLIRPSIHIKAFSAIELDYMFSRSGLTVEEGLNMLKESGLGSIPGGGAEIFADEIRSKICPGKTSSEKWLQIHETAHRLGIYSNATMLYGHIENYSHRIDHMERLRRLQDKTRGFNAFIPLKYRKNNNPLYKKGEVNLLEDMRNFAIARIYLDNFRHIKTYWPMLGKEHSQISLSFGADDLDGTIYDTTKIYSMAGAEEKNPSMSINEICTLIRRAGYKPVERDSLYNIVKEW
ncbi:MAG TPA: aminofutalosine synthase MqnE [Bacteroidales bacterium]|nr:aminofutalosine synthase MqnE [Bacteroidales bacterium]HCI56472.1 aminofutalosine synthase MqnE [Bacteroidales bacterium]HOU95573.1 aminofutalosine synthase MqnE [Bacteroidales bacterium]HQG36196.1 aminofutalosine synthase MqnE [Bacteroidales bacterium]HQG53473.1 aminofutalosine synthase MqnE [Bacteroidales bacterium]